MLRRLRSIVGLVAAVALLGAHASTTLHLLLGEHAICPEHGELIEGTPRSPSAVLVSAVSGVPARATLASAPTAEAHAHDLCLTLLVQRERSLLSVPPLATDQAVVATQRPFTVDDVRGPIGLRRYRLAPKNSPPA